MDNLKKLGIFLYYFGLFTMVSGFLILSLGLSSMLTSVTSQISMTKSGGTDPNCPSPPCLANTAMDLGPANLVVDLVGPFLDNYFIEIGFLQPNDQFQQGYYPKFRQFFVFLIVGLAIMIIGIILRLANEVEEFMHGQKKKEKELDKKSVLYRQGAPTRAEEIMERIRQKN